MNRLVERFLFEKPSTPLEPRFNIAPSQMVAALRRTNDDAARQLTLFRWGLIPSWAKDPAIASRLINARSETIAEKPSFRDAFQHRRCLILADGYYEWQRESGSKRKQPYYIKMRDDQPFAFAGLWELWRDPNQLEHATCTIITTPANDLTQPIHPRMPAIIAPERYDDWLTSSEDQPHTLEFLRPFPSHQMVLFPVSSTVNSPRNEDPACILPAEDPSSDASDTKQRRLF